MDNFISTHSSMNLNTQDNSVNSNSTAIKTIAVHATMRDVYYVLKAIKKE